MSADKIAAAISKWSEELVAWDRWRGINIGFTRTPPHPAEIGERVDRTAFSWKFVLGGKKYGESYFLMESYELGTPALSRVVAVLQTQARRAVNLLLEFPERETGDLSTIGFRVSSFNEH